MGNTGRQFSQRDQFLRLYYLHHRVLELLMSVFKRLMCLTQLCLRSFAFSNIPKDSHDPNNFPVVISDRRFNGLDNRFSSVPHIPIFKLLCRASLHDLFIIRPVFFGQFLEEKIIISFSYNINKRTVQILRESLVARDENRIIIFVKHLLRQAVKEQSKLNLAFARQLFAFLKSLFCQFPLSNITDKSIELIFTFRSDSPNSHFCKKFMAVMMQGRKLQRFSKDFPFSC